MRRLKILGLLSCGLAAVTFVTLLITSQIGRSKMASRGGGAIPFAADLEYPELTDSENAAFLYRAAWKALEATPDGTSNQSISLISNYRNSKHARIGVEEGP